MAQAENTQAFMIQLPWTAPEQPNVQAIVLQYPKEQKIYLDLAHSTDWVVAASIFISALISFLGFIATIYIVRKSTQQNIESNKILIESQNELKINELKAIYKQKWIDDLRILVSTYLSTLEKISNRLIFINHTFTTENYTNLRFIENSSERLNEYEEINALFQEIPTYSARLSLYLEPSNEKYQRLLEREKILQASICTVFAVFFGEDVDQLGDKIRKVQSNLNEFQNLLISIILDKDLGGV